MSDDPANQQPPAPPDVYLIGEAGFTPVFPKVGEPVTYYWSEANRGGEHPDTYHARVVSTKEFGAFVECLPGKEGLVHISELADFRVKKTEDVVRKGDMIWVKCIGIEDNGKVRLSRRWSGCRSPPRT